MVMIFRKSLDIMTIWYDTQKVSGYHQRKYGKFLDIIFIGVNIQKVSFFCSIRADYQESFGLINS